MLQGPKALLTTLLMTLVRLRELSSPQPRDWVILEASSGVGEVLSPLCTHQWVMAAEFPSVKLNTLMCMCMCIEDMYTLTHAF